MSHSAKAVANYFLRKGKTDSIDIDPMKLQKIVYNAHGWHLALFDKPLIDEFVEAWTYGPVIPSIYHEFKSFGSHPINTFALDADVNPTRVYIPEVDDEEVKPLLNKIWVVYRSFSGIQLSNITHRVGGPWDVTRKKYHGIRNAPVPNDLIKEYFVSLSSSAARR